MTSPERPAEAGSGEFLPITLLKGLAMAGVLALHAWPRGALDDSISGLHVGQAVPMFALLLGLNGLGSHRRRGGLLGGSYLPGLRRRLLRILPAFLVIYVVATIAAIARNEYHAGLGIVQGILPLSGPGNYFVTLLFQWAILAPLLLEAYRRRPAATLAAGAAVQTAFELLAPHVSLGPYWYEASILNYTGFIALGCLLADRLDAGRAPWPAWMRMAALAGAAWVLVIHVLDLEPPWLRPDAWERNALVAFYVAALAAAGLAGLPRTAKGALRPLADLGRASYHVFLVQILWFALIPHNGFGWFALALVACGGAGVFLWRLDERLLKPLRRRGRPR